MKTIIVILLFIVVNHCNSQWFTQNSGSDKSLNKVFFTGQDTGYIAAGSFALAETGALLKTTNGGVNWANLNYGSFQRVYSLYFFNSTTGFAACNGNLLLKTTNGGINWSSVSLPVIYSAIGAVYFTSKDTGYICGHYSKDFILCKTYNGGATWFQKYTYAGSIYIHNSFHFINSATGFATRSFKTTNSGENWTSVGGFSPNEVFFMNALTGIGVGGNINAGVIYKTTNQGNNWRIIETTSPGASNNAVKFLNFNVGLISSDSGVIKYTYNAGENWSRISSGTNVKKNFNDIHFINQITGYIVGDSGTILKTTNSGGLTFINENSEVVSDFFLHQNYPNPFNPSTIINYQLTINSFVALNVYDVNGRLVKELVNQKQSAGNYSIDFDGSGLPSGTYIYRLKAGDFSETKKMVLLK